MLTNKLNANYGFENALQQSAMHVTHRCMNSSKAWMIQSVEQCIRMLAKQIYTLNLSISIKCQFIGVDVQTRTFDAAQRANYSYIGGKRRNIPMVDCENHVTLKSRSVDWRRWYLVWQNGKVMKKILASGIPQYWLRSNLQGLWPVRFVWDDAQNKTHFKITIFILK